MIAFIKQLYGNYNFFYLWLGQIFSQVGTSFLVFVLGIKAYEISGGGIFGYSVSPNFAVSLVIVSYGLASLFFGVPAGIIVDRLSRKNILIYSSIIRFALITTFIFLPKSLVSIVVLIFLFNSVTQFFYPAESASIPILVRKNYLIRANSIYTVSFFISHIFGYLIGGILLNFLSYRIVFLTIAIFYVIAVFCIWLIKYPKEFVQSTVNINNLFVLVIRGFYKAIKVIKSTFSVKISLIYIGISQIVIGVLWALQPGLSVEVLGIELKKSGLYVMVPLVVGVLFGAILLNKLLKYHKEKYFIEIGIIGSSLAFGCIYLLDIYDVLKFKIENKLLNGEALNVIDNVTFLSKINLLSVAITSMFFIGLFSSFIIVIYNTKLQYNTKKDMIGRVYGILQTLVTISGAVPVVLSGYLADKWGIGQIFLSVALFILILHFLLKCRYKKYFNIR